MKMIMMTKAQAKAINEDLKMRKEMTYDFVAIVSYAWLEENIAGVGFVTSLVGIRYTRADRPGWDVTVFDRDGNKTHHFSGGLD